MSAGFLSTKPLDIEKLITNSAAYQRDSRMIFYWHTITLFIYLELCRLPKFSKSPTTLFDTITKFPIIIPKENKIKAMETNIFIFDGFVSLM